MPIWVKLVSYRGTWKESGKTYRYPDPFQVEESDRVKAGLRCNILKRLSTDEIPKAPETADEHHEDNEH